VDSYDDENFDDGFDDEALASRVNLDLWRKLFAYARRYPRELTGLACARSSPPPWRCRSR
jgi:hypothetical protein